jgi:spore maturation protein CgeB
VRILYVAMKYDYGRPEQGESFEHWTFYDSLARMGHTILYFDFMTLLGELGRDAMNLRLLEVVRAEQPDVLFSVLFRDEIDTATLRRISAETETVTLNWFCDDVWRFDDFTSRYAPCFDWSITTASSAIPRYERIGVRNVIRSQWACNHWVYRPLDLPLRHDVTFVGQPHGARRIVLDALRAEGIRVEAWGHGWENGRLDQERMVEVFGTSRINLNLANASSAPASFSQRSRDTVLRAAAAALRRIPGSAPIRSFGKRVLYGAGSEPAAAAAAAAAPVALLDEVPTERQMKGRNFEVPGCGGFLLTDPALELASHYVPGKEVGVFDTLRDLIEQTRYYLTHEEERAAIAAAGHARTLAGHTYVHRFAEIFRTIGLPEPDAASILASAVRRGDTVPIR